MMKRTIWALVYTPAQLLKHRAFINILNGLTLYLHTIQKYFPTFVNQFWGGKQHPAQRQKTSKTKAILSGALVGTTCLPMIASIIIGSITFAALETTLASPLYAISAAIQWSKGKPIQIPEKDELYDFALTHSYLKHSLQTVHNSVFGQKTVQAEMIQLTNQTEASSIPNVDKPKKTAANISQKDQSSRLQKDETPGSNIQPP